MKGYERGEIKIEGGERVEERKKEGRQEGERKRECSSLVASTNYLHKIAMFDIQLLKYNEYYSYTFEKINNI